MPQRRALLRWLGALTGAAICLAPPLTAQAPRAPSLNRVIDRVGAYATGYATRLSAIVAEEHYTQSLEHDPGDGVEPRPAATTRVIRSDLVLVPLGAGEHWIAWRDAFEVDGAPVRDRTDRLIALLQADGEAAWRQAEALTNASARFNLGNTLIDRNVNTPTFFLHLLTAGRRERFRFRRLAIHDGQWEIEFRERDRPTIVRRSDGGNQPLRGTIGVDPETGEVWRTHVTWEQEPDGAIDVTFGRVADIDVLVPVRMAEWYRGRSTTIRGEATYRDFRRFETSARVVTP